MATKQPIGSTQLQDAIQTTIGGMSQAVHPYLLQSSQYAMGVNITSREGVPATRPRFKKLCALSSGSYQGGIAYHLSDVDRFVYGASGSVYGLNMSTLASTTHSTALNASQSRFFFCQAERYVIVQDGYSPAAWSDANWPVIVHEDTTVDQSAEANYERLPKGSVMAYGHGRIFVVTPYIWDGANWSGNLGSVGFVAGDIIKSYELGSQLKFSETNYLNEGGRIILPEELGYIHMMAFQKNVMTGIGQGPLIVGAERGFSAFSVNAPRVQWKDIDLGIVMFSGVDSVGTYSPFGFQNYNSEIIYRSVDGIRAMRKTTTDAQQGTMDNDPMSNEIRDITDLDTLTTLNNASITTLDKRVFVTVNPEGNHFLGVASLDLSPVQTMGQNAPAAWDGVWTGFNFEQIFTAVYQGKERLFAVVSDDSNNNYLYVLDGDEVYDKTSDRPKCRFYTKYFTFGDPDIFRRKVLDAIELWVSEIDGQVDFAAYYRADNYPYWCAMDSGTVNSGNSGNSQRRNRIRMVPSDIKHDPVTNDRTDHGYRFQICIQWTGKCRIDMVRLLAKTDIADRYDLASTLDGTETVLSLPSDQVELDDYDYEVAP